PVDLDKKKGIVYASSPGSSYGPMKIINNIFNSDLVFNLQREEESRHVLENGEVGVSGRDFALVSGDMWLQALKWFKLECSLMQHFGINMWFRLRIS
ncbi:ubiquitin carboxyl-terminal hydrolase 8-like, partial [Trifolium medium]|nr:ubiquitin carboxyl-terminal hydrolase 8-like [Trifolium medium]